MSLDDPTFRRQAQQRQLHARTAKKSASELDGGGAARLQAPAKSVDGTSSILLVEPYPTVKSQSNANQQ